jgi:hypothetical protein
MHKSLGTKLSEFIKAWTMVESIVTGIFFLSAILFIFGSAIYSAAHHVKF